MLACGVIDGYVFPAYSPDWSKHQARSLVLEWFEASDRFALLPADVMPLPGDAGCYKIGKCVHHCALVLDAPTLIHVLRDDEVDYGRADDASLAKRLACYYRPLPR